MQPATRTTLWIFLALAAAILALFLRLHRTGTSAGDASSAGVPLAVLGDSDSHAYHDSIAFPAGSEKRGGRYRSTTWQWTELLQRLRGEELDQGAWGVHGTRGMVARANRWLGREGRSPPKQDYRYNFARSGAECSDLLEGYSQQARALLSLMDQDPARWRNGVVLIRIGVNNFGDAQDMDLLARNPQAAAVQEKIAGCLDAIQRTVALLRGHHPGLRFVLVGIFDNANWPKYLDRWHDPFQLGNIGQGLDVFDNALKDMARKDPGIVFFDDRAWFAERWGSRNDAGLPAYHDLVLGELSVRNAAGDAPDHAVLADGHAGTAWNAEWARALVDLLNSRFQLAITPISRAEIVATLGGKGSTRSEAGQPAGLREPVPPVAQP
ncbi:MAG: hypothetical protein ABWY48_03020 [Pseudoxanthomonas sp.]